MAYQQELLLLLLLLQFFCLFDVFVCQTYPSMSCIWQDGNSMDQVGAYVNSGNAFISGTTSDHSNHYEDREYSWKFCKPTGSGLPSNVQISWNKILPYTDYDDEWIRGCGGNTGISTIWSDHDNHYEDRIFSFRCRAINNNYYLDSCHWQSNWINDWDDTINFVCQDNGMIRSVESYHSNSKEDRRWNFECCRLKKWNTLPNTPSMSCYNSGFVNDYDGAMNVNLDGLNYLFGGIYSEYNNNKRDRRFKFRYCQPDDDDYANDWLSGDNIYSVNSAFSNYEQDWSLSCNRNSGNSAIIGILSNHDNGKEDRQYKVKCGNIDSSRFGLINCGWTGYLNKHKKNMHHYGDDFFNCPNNGIMRGIKSIWTNDDRLFEIECCSLAKSKFVNLKGKWVQRSNCQGCGVEYSVEYGIETSRTSEITQEYSNELSIAISTGYEFELFGNKASVDVTVTGTISQSTTTALSDTFTQFRSTTITYACDKTYLYQWQESGNVYISDLDEYSITMYGNNFLCTDIQYPKCALGDCYDNNCQICQSDVESASTHTHSNGKYIGVFLRNSQYKNKLTYDDALSYCEYVFGTTLASIHSISDNNDALSAVRIAANNNFDNSYNIWIGLNDIISDDNFVWTDNTQYNYNNWRQSTNDPKNGFNTYDCAIIREDNGLWINVQCDDTVYNGGSKSFVCNAP